MLKESAPSYASPYAKRLLQKWISRCAFRVMAPPLAQNQKVLSFGFFARSMTLGWFLWFAHMSQPLEVAKYSSVLIEGFVRDLDWAEAFPFGFSIGILCGKLAKAFPFRFPTVAEKGQTTLTLFFFIDFSFYFVRNKFFRQRVFFKNLIKFETKELPLLAMEIDVRPSSFARSFSLISPSGSREIIGLALFLLIVLFG